MRLRSTASLFVFFVACALIINLLLGLFKQIVSQKKISLYLDQKKVELEKLEEENKILKEGLKETEKPDFLSSEAGRLFGLTKDGLFPQNTAEEEKPKTQTVPVKIPNWQKWANLFK
ncbi:hypothetical protein COV89_02180 [Candidatus Shapirobacteria bacterium CG11_big_fil_rev_8_21_14_0_20_40_12]|uniref:Uncharacterized protein n=3 Tax=Candidatus Shapironibacteriota TaxID=1752721 RepID=A0A2M8EVP0_9BACT|nr:MAG: hypothetical protein COV89_02180 [Candidatus Shapirobacteria bacterium CG11_big_fil_rev_8_21_14_0_20_40_12]PJC29168.1 MAG: hypothetical protein CO053_00705 [Candidatus Shapirobacteria bacterium CG_4_9_14_0_2_um_filter_40_11]PJC77110.1 MAG: hypothetical protein CO010_01005 [Candidatus Shapirobacteria bacterium CG_4_8_14_3_um_filter_39_11]